MHNIHGGAHVQEVGHDETVPQVQTQLFDGVLALSGVDAVKGQLQGARGGAVPMSPAHKADLWDALIRGCFATLVAATWTVPALYLVTHIHLMVLGRHNYLASFMASRSNGACSPPV